MAQLNIHLVLQTPSTDYNGSIWLSFVWNTVYPCLQVFPDVKKKAVSRSGKQVNVYLGLVKKSVTVTSSADHGSYVSSSYADLHSLFWILYCQAGILNFSILNQFPVTLISTYVYIKTPQLNHIQRLQLFTAADVTCVEYYQINHSS